MKTIGEKIKNTRIKSGVTIEEAAEDLNYKPSQLIALEEGDYHAFKDKFLLKTILTDYSKYLGLETEEIIDEFNDFVFESTSKIPIEDIEKASKLKEKMADDKIASPYTVSEEDKPKIPKIIIISLVLLLIVCISIFCYNIIKKQNRNSNFKISYNLTEGVL